MTAETPLTSPLTLTLSSPEATTDLARAMGALLSPGDVLLLSGSIGAGKTHFARSLIQSILLVQEDVPSPTFTLVQEYDTRQGALWHADLYRLGSADEVEELGLRAAFDDAICLVEWPDRLAELAPSNALSLAFEALAATDGTDELRRLTVTWTDPHWAARMSTVLNVTPTPVREAQLPAFLSKVGWEGAEAEAMAGDAGSRFYTRLRRGKETAILMQDPDGDASLFARLSRHLTGKKLSAPLILAETTGMLLIEDLGTRLLADIAFDAEDERRLYLAATDTLVALHGHEAPARLPTATPDHLAQAVDLAFTHYTALPDLAVEAAEVLRPICAEHAAPEGVMVLRDFHAENLLELPDRSGPARIGLLDFQDALCGNRAYDLVSLCRDVRRDLHPDTEQACIQAYVAATEVDEDAFRAAYAVLGVQRNLRILGVFARLALTQGKTRYLEFLPRCWSHIQLQLQHPVLAPLQPIVAQLPPPDPAFVADLLSRCPSR